MKRIVILFSGRGSNMQKLIENLSDRVDIVKCITDKKDAKGLEICKNHSIESHILSSDFQKELIELVDSLNIDLVVCAGFMRILPKEFVERFKCVNIHPSLLPRHQGLNAIKRSYNDDFNDAGITIHYVDEGVDTGKVIAQYKIDKIKDETIEEFEDRIHSLEHKYYSEAVSKILNI